MGASNYLKKIFEWMNELMNKHYKNKSIISYWINGEYLNASLDKIK